jgi:hypothetical protein
MKTIMHGNQKIVIDTTGGFVATFKDRKGNSTKLEIALDGVVREIKGGTLVPYPKAILKALKEYDNLFKKSVIAV